MKTSLFSPSCGSWPPAQGVEKRNFPRTLLFSLSWSFRFPARGTEKRHFLISFSFFSFLGPMAPDARGGKEKILCKTPLFLSFSSSVTSSVEHKREDSFIYPHFSPFSASAPAPKNKRGRNFLDFHGNFSHLASPGSFQISQAAVTVRRTAAIAFTARPAAARPPLISIGTA